jgi:exodeoxyribonuclease X
MAVERAHTNLPIRVLDLETTGQSLANGGVVEAGWQDLAYDGRSWSLTGPVCSVLVNPGMPISPETSAVHHIIDEDVFDAPAWPQAAQSIFQPDGQRFVAFAAHRASFEQRWCLPALIRGVAWICTYKCALRLWPDAPTHSNQGLRYWRRPSGLDRATSLPAHRAGPDAYVTAHHLRDMLALASVDEMIAWSAEPALLPRVPFGAHRGRAWRDLDAESLESIMRGAAGTNADLLFSARFEKLRRDGPPPVMPMQPTLAL